MKKIKGIFSLLILGFGLLINHTFSDFEYNGVYYQDGFYYNEEKGLITFIYGSGVSTRQDKNLGATSVYDGTISSYGSINCDNYGNFYQFGNNYGFSCESVMNGNYDNVSVELTGNHIYENPINLSVPYSNTSNYDISDSWGGVSSISPLTMQGPCLDGYYLPSSDMINDLMSLFQSFGFGANSSSDNFRALLYYTKFIPQSKSFGLPFSSYSINRVNFRYSNNLDYFNGYSLPSFGLWDNKLRYNTPLSNGSLGVPKKINGQYFLSARCFRNSPLLPSNTWVSLTGGDTSLFPPEVDEGGNQDFPDPILDGGVFDANTYLIEESIKCYLTSGEVCNSPFTYENSTNYVNNYDHQERVRNSAYKTGYLTFNNSVDMLSQYCLNVNTIQYSFCSQLYLYEGSPITYYYNNGYFNYIISGSGWQVNLGSLWSGQLGYAYCEGPYCSNFNEGLPQFIRKDTGDYSDFGFSGEYVSLDFFKNYFENGFFFQCPFSYSGSYFTIGSKLIDRLDQHDPLKPINCFISAFSHGVKSSFFGDSKLGLSHTGVFLQNTGPNATRFYTFIDIVLCLGYIFLFSKLFKFLKKH